MVTKQDRTPNSSKSGYALFVQEGVITFERWAEGEEAKVSAGGISGAYAHVAAIYDVAAIWLHVDGVATAPRSTPLVVPATAAPLLFGGSDFIDGEIEHPFEGSIDELAIYGTALRAEQIAAHLAASKP